MTETVNAASFNHVRLIGRISADPEERILPSGDSIVSFRLVVPRSAAAKKRSKQRVDTIECVAWSARAKRSAAARNAGDTVEVDGELRRRFTRAAGVPQSWVSVEISRCRIAEQGR